MRKNRRRRGMKHAVAFALALGMITAMPMSAMAQPGNIDSGNITVEASSDDQYVSPETPENLPPAENTELTPTSEFANSRTDHTQRKITILPSAHGKLSVNFSEMEAGGTVTITAISEQGYALVYSSLTVAMADGQFVPLKRVRTDANKFKFTMPTVEVTISAVFGQIPPEVPSVEDTNLPPAADTDFPPVENATRYSINVVQPDNGNISVNPAEANPGDTVTFTATANNGYVVAGASVALEGGQQIPVLKIGEGEYNFTMPNEAVTITAKIIPEAVPQTEVYLTDIPAAVSQWAATEITIPEAVPQREVPTIAGIFEDNANAEQNRAPGEEEECNKENLPGENQQSEDEPGETQQGGDQQEGTEQGGSQQGGTEQGGDQQEGTEQGGSQQGGTEQGGSQEEGTEQGGSQEEGTESGGDQQVTGVGEPGQEGAGAGGNDDGTASSKLESHDFPMIQ